MFTYMELQLTMAAEFCLDALLQEAGLSQRELAARSGVSPTTVNRMAKRLTGRVDLDTLDSLSSVLSDVLRRRIEPGDLIRRVPEKRGGKRGVS